MPTSHAVIVRARPEGYWENSGVTIRNGDHVIVKYVSGSWCSNPNWNTSDAAGNGSYIARGSYLKPGAPEGALIGKVGGNNSGGGSEAFLIGNLASVPNGLEGTLWLSVNDEPAGFGDNTGSITVQITIG
ncbi:LecA/PA-IL family lectin [Aeromonas salmonicida]|uniref:LecA/PA-IL family lectin n=1 Tax=Aeromonas salmonicida TaxID=645 RepID=UPI003CF945C8